MAQQTYAQAFAKLGLNDAQLQAALTAISGQNVDGTQYTLPVSVGAGLASINILYPNVAGNNAGTAISATSGVVAAATATCTLTGVAAKFTWITGFVVSGVGATSAAVVTMTLTGLVTGTQSYAIGVPAAVAPVNLPVSFGVPVPSSAVNTSLVLSMPTFGAGATGVSINATGFLL